MKPFRPLLMILATVSALIAIEPLVLGDILEALGLRKKATAAMAMSEEQITAGLKEALARGVEQAVTNLGRPGGFLSDARVKIPLPEKLQWTEKALRSVGQEQLVNEFVETMNHGAEEAVPAAASVLGEAVRVLTVEDARTILTSTNAAATAYFRRTSGTNLQARFLPMVKAATDRVGVTARYKQLLDTAGKDMGVLGSFGRSLFGGDTLDLDKYVTQKALDGLFLKIGEEEMKIRENPAARTTELLQKVFSGGTKRAN